MNQWWKEAGAGNTARIPSTTNNEVDYGFTPSFTELKKLDSVNVSGKTAIILFTERENHYYSIYQTGPHIFADSNFSITFEVMMHYTNTHERKAYFTNVRFNNLPLSGTISNKKSASKIIHQIIGLSNGEVYEQEGLSAWSFFVGECSALLVYNQVNKNRLLEDYSGMSHIERNKFIEETSALKMKVFDEIANTIDELGNENHYSSGESNYEIYLKILGFKSGNGGSYEDIKDKYRKMAKKYHPDAPTGDEERFRLLKESYDYLMKYYPR